MLTDPITCAYKTIGSCSIKLDIYRDARSAPGAPVIIYIHGGALVSGSRNNIHPKQLQLYREAGYAVISIDYRLAPETKLPGIIEDLLDAFRWIGEYGPKRFAVDCERIAVVGHSAGGYLALMSGFCAKPLPKVLISFYGYGDIVGDWYTKPDSFYCKQPLVSEEESGRLTEGPMTTEAYEGRGKEKFYLYCRQRGIWPQQITGHDPADDPSFFVPYCPVRNITRTYPPTLLLHGDQDTDVPHQQSILMAQELSRHQVRFRLMTIPGAGHGFDQRMDCPEAQVVFTKELAFLHDNL